MLQITIIKGTNLVSRDKNGLSDPFVVFDFDDEGLNYFNINKKKNQKKLNRTHTIYKVSILKK